MAEETILLIASSEKDANIYYASKFFTPDPFIFIQMNDQKFLAVSLLEADRAKKEAKVNKVFSSDEAREKVILKVLRDLGASQNILVPKDFPFAYGKLLEANGYSLRTKPEPFFEERAIKTQEEIEAIIQAQRAVEEVLTEVLGVIKKSRISGELIYSKKGDLLTSESIKRFIDVRLMERGCLAKDTVVACGNDACDPHCQGSGPLKPSSLIVIDIFPRSTQTLYWADMSRTVVKGKASPDPKKQYKAVLEAQLLALGMIKEGVNGFDIYNAVVDLFESKGFRSGEIKGRQQGFFHGVGHGVGLDIHEPPRISKIDQILKTGQVVTVEPGLYYWDVGGVRIEDLVVVTKWGCLNLTQFPKEELMEL